MVMPTSSPANETGALLKGDPPRVIGERQALKGRGSWAAAQGLFGTLDFAFQLRNRSCRTRGPFPACLSRRRNTFILGGISDSHQPTLGVSLVSRFYEPSPPRRGQLLARGQKSAGGQNGHIPNS